MSVLLAAVISLPSPGVALLQPPIDEAVRQLVRLTPEPGQATLSSTSPAPARVFRGDVDQWRGLVGEWFSDVDRAMCVLEWESEGDPNAVSPTDDHGLFQIHYPIWGPHFGVSRADLYDPVLNVRLASLILKAQGWGAWSAVTRGKC